MGASSRRPFGHELMGVVAMVTFYSGTVYVVDFPGVPQDGSGDEPIDAPTIGFSGSDAHTGIVAQTLTACQGGLTGRHHKMNESRTAPAHTLPGDTGIYNDTSSIPLPGGGCQVGNQV